MVINDPEVLAEVTSAFGKYEEALQANDNVQLASMFLESALSVDYSLDGVQYGYLELLLFRATQAPFTRKLEETIITSYGRDCATASTLFLRDDAPGKIGRQMQTWVKTDSGWKIAAAHSSMMDA